MNALKTPSGVNYLEDFVSNDIPTVIYLHGAGERNNYGDFSALKRTSFYTKFYAANQGKYNFFIPLQTTASYSWVNDKGGVFAPTFIRYIVDEYKLALKPFLTGFSMGSSYATASFMIGELQGIAVASGAGDYKQVLAVGKSGLPALSFHGTRDNVNPVLQAKKVALEWYGMPKENWHEIATAGHNADQWLYAVGSGLKEFIDSLYPVVEPVKPGIYIDGKWYGDTECEFEGHKIQYKN